MRASIRELIVDVMAHYPDGVDATTIGNKLGKERQTIRKALERIHYAYIDRWVKSPRKQGRFIAIWCLVKVPDHCPHPKRVEPRKVETVWRTS